MSKFWKFFDRTVTNEADVQKTVRVLRLEGPIAQESWWGDEVTPTEFRDELESVTGDIEVWINSPGGDVFAAVQIYNMLMEHKGNVKVMIDAIAASAATIIAMAGTDIFISPGAMMMIHNPSTIAFGDYKEMQKAIDILDEVKESIINAYQIKTGLSRAKLAKLMEDETWMNARRAVELGFADKIAYANSDEGTAPEAVDFSNKSYVASITNKLAEAFTVPEATVENHAPISAQDIAEGTLAITDLIAGSIDEQEPPEPVNTVDAKQFYDRLEALKNMN